MKWNFTILSKCCAMEPRGGMAAVCIKCCLDFRCDFKQHLLHVLDATTFFERPRKEVALKLGGHGNEVGP